MSLMPPTIIRELKLKQFGYDVTPFGPYFQAFPDGRAITVYADDHQKSYDSIAQFSKRDADTLPKWEEWLKGVSDVLGPLLLQVPPHVGSMKPGDLLAHAAVRVEDAQARRARRRRRHAAVHDVGQRSAQRLVRVRRDQGDADRQRRDRHVGRSRRAGHRLRDAAPLDRRRRRRPPRLVGVPAGRHGRGQRLDPHGRRGLRLRDPHERAGEARSSCAAAARSASCSRTAASSAPRSSSPRSTRRSRSST